MGNELNASQKKFCSLLKELKKKNRLLEIIKKSAMRLVSLEIDDYGDGKKYRVYDAELYGHIDITEEEYKLLKGWLENGK